MTSPRGVLRARHVIGPRRAVAAFTASLVLALGLGGGAALADTGTPATPTADITTVHESAGRVQFVLSVSDLPAGATIDPASVTVTAAGRELTASAVTAGSGSSAAALPRREVMLALDTSGSMAGSGIAAARAAALSYTAALPADVRIGLLTFADRPDLVLRPTTDRAAVRAAIGKVTAGGNTALYDGIVAAVAAMRRAPADTERRIVVLSDGKDTTSRDSIADAIAALNSQSVGADVVAFRLGDRVALGQIAASSRGRMLPAAGAGDLAGAFATASRAFDQQLVVEATVPRDLAGEQVTLHAAATAGTTHVGADRSLTLPDAAPTGVSHAGGHATATATATPVTRPSTTLWIVLGLAFLALLVVSMSALWVPATSSERAARRARLAEVSRYRVAQTVGRAGATAAGTATESRFTRSALSVVDRVVRARGKRHRMVEELERAGLRMRPEEWAALQLCAVVFAAALVAVPLGSVLGVLPGAVLGWLACRVFVRLRTGRRAARFEAQLPDMLQLVAGSLRSGFSLNQAITAVVAEGTEPTASEFARALTEVRLGADLEDALDSVAERMKCLDLHLVVMAVRISREVGGNLAEVLLTTVSTMRERSQLRGQIKVLTAEGRLSAKILIGLPFLMGAYLLVFKKGYLNPLVASGMGIGMLVLGVVLLSVGSFWLSRLVKIEV